MPHIYPIMRIQLSFVQFSLLCYEFCILSKTECKSIYYHFRPDHQSSSFRKLARDKWICRETCDFFSYTFFFAFSPLVNSIIVFFLLESFIFLEFSSFGCLFCIFGYFCALLQNLFLCGY